MEVLCYAMLWYAILLDITYKIYDIIFYILYILHYIIYIMLG